MESSGIQRLYRTYGQTTFGQLTDEQELTRKQKAWGILRCPRLWKVTKFEVGDQAFRTVVRTKASFTAPTARFAGPQGAPPLANERMGPYHFPSRRLHRRWRPGLRYW
jgi:hypothetical protein